MFRNDKVCPGEVIKKYFQKPDKEIIAFHIKDNETDDGKTLNKHFTFEHLVGSRYMVKITFTIEDLAGNTLYITDSVVDAVEHYNKA